MNGDGIADRRLHPLSIGLRYIKNLPSTLLGLPVLITYVSDVGFANFLFVAAIVAVLVLVLNWLAWSRFHYGVGGREIVIESGLLTRNRRSIPFERIQDVNIERGPLERLLGLAKVRIETGGAGQDEGTLDSLSLAEADRLRMALKAGRSQGDEPSDLADAPAPVLFAMRLPRVLLAGLFNFSLLYLAGLFALLQTFEQFLPFDLYDWGRWIGFAEDRLAGRFTPGMIAAVLLLALALGVVTGVARTLARDYGFRLSEEKAGLRRERGLFTRTEVVIPRRKVQLALVRRGIVKRLTGWHALSFQTLSADREEAGQQSAAPLARVEEIVPILDAAGELRLPPKAALIRVSRRHVLKSAALYGTAPLVAIGVAAWFFPAVLFALGLVPLLVLGAVLERRAHRYALIGETLFVQRGFWERKLWIVPVAKGQTASVSRSPVQRLLGLATVLVDTPGASMLSDPRIVDLGMEDAMWLADRLAGMLRQ